MTTEPLTVEPSNSGEQKKEKFFISRADRELFQAASDGDLKSITRLVAFIKKPAFVDARSIVNHTPLMWAAMSGKIDAMKQLIALGADLMLKDNSKKDALDHMFMNGYNDSIADIEQFFKFIREDGFYSEVEQKNKTYMDHIFDFAQECDSLEELDDEIANIIMKYNDFVFYRVLDEVETGDTP